MCGAGLSPGVLASFSESMRQLLFSSLSQLWLFKQSTLHRMMGYRANGYEGQGTCCYYNCHSSRFCRPLRHFSFHKSLSCSLLIQAHSTELKKKGASDFNKCVFQSGVDFEGCLPSSSSLFLSSSIHFKLLLSSSKQGSKLEVK